VQCHVERGARHKFDQRAACQMRGDQRFGVQAPAKAGQAGLDKSLGRGHPVAGKGRAGQARGLAGDPTLLQAVLVREGEGGRMCQRLRRGAGGKPARHIGRRGGGAVAQRAKRDRVAALQRAGMRGDGGHDLSAPEPVLADVLIVDHEVEEEPLSRCQRRDDPGGQAVGVDRKAQGCGAGRQRGQIGGEGGFEEAHFVVMPDQAQTGGGGGTGLAAPDEEGARRLLQRLDALADGGGGDVQIGRRKVKRPAPVHGGEGGELGGIKHQRG